MSENTPSSITEKEPIIFVSEIDKFIYCERAWWYKFVLHESESNPVAQEKMLQGNQVHEVKAEQVQQIEKRLSFAKALLWIGIATIVTALILKILGVG